MLQDSASGRAEAVCANCGSPLQGSFCHECGQKDVDLDRPFWTLVGEWLGTLFAFDARVWRTLGPLLAKPGFLTVEYLQGRRARYVPPLRLYFFASIAMFLALAWSGYSIVTTAKDGDSPVRIYSTEGGGLVTMTEAGEESGEKPVGSNSEPEEEDSDAGGSDPGQPESPRSISDQEAASLLAERLNRLQGAQAETVNSIFRQRLAQTLILLAFVFAVMTRALFWRRDGRLFHHLIFSVHVHAAAFAGILVVNLVGGLVDRLLAALGLAEIVSGVLGLLFILGLPIYVFLALRRFERRGRLATLWRLIVLFVLYVLSLATTLLGTMFLTASSL